MKGIITDNGKSRNHRKPRRAEFITPIPKPRKRKGVAAQEQMVFNEGKRLSTRKQQYDPASYLLRLIFIKKRD